jgi:hypothetical protein
MKQLVVLEQWNSYRITLLPDAPPIQITECKRAFYAGAQALFYKIMMELSQGSNVEATDVKMLDDIQTELQQFGKDVLEGRA